MRTSERIHSQILHESREHTVASCTLRKNIVCRKNGFGANPLITIKSHTFDKYSRWQSKDWVKLTSSTMVCTIDSHNDQIAEDLIPNLFTRY